MADTDAESSTSMHEFAHPAPQEEPGDETLVERLRAFDQRAWAEFYDLHHPRIWRYVYARIGDRDEADDLAAQCGARGPTVP